MKKAFTSLNLLIALLLSTGLLSLLVSSLNILSHSVDKSYNQEYLASLQIQNILAHAKDLLVEDNLLSFNYLGEARQLKYVNQKLIMTPGTVIYFLDVEKFKFEIFDGKVILNIYRDYHYRYLIGLYE